MRPSRADKRSEPGRGQRRLTTPGSGRSGLTTGQGVSGESGGHAAAIQLARTYAVASVRRIKTTMRDRVELPSLMNSWPTSAVARAITLTVTSPAAPPVGGPSQDSVTLNPVLVVGAE
jgi:hypothetical protein